MQADIVPAGRLAIAGLVGLAVGLEREWSGQATGVDARFAGLRTFFMLGLIGGIAGVLASLELAGLAVAVTFAAMAMVVAAYVVSTRRDAASPDGTTEVAAIVVVALGALAGAGRQEVAAGAGAVVALLLREKAQLHWMVRRLYEPELRAGFQFAVLAVVVLPLLPDGPFLGSIALRPRLLWAMVLLLSGLNFLGFIARRIIGDRGGLGITGAVGGVVSSTAVTYSFSRKSRAPDEPQEALARGVVAACVVLIPRVLVVASLLNTRVAAARVPFVVPPLVIGAATLVATWNRDDDTSTPRDMRETNPLQLLAAMRMAIAFQVAMTAIGLVGGHWGPSGIYVAGAALGLTDVDALTVSMSRTGLLNTQTAARAIAIGILANTLLKLAIALVLGGSRYRRGAGVGLAGLAAGSTLGLLFA